MIANVILWPADVSAREGICYGWTRPLVCVAGVLPPGNRLVRTLAACPLY